MADPGHVFRRAFSWLPAQFASQSDAPVGPRQFGSTEHLSTEAIAAFVDNELRLTPHLRAANHLSLCPQCAAEVEAQRQARSALRESRPIAIPSSLLGQLSQIPLRSSNTTNTADTGADQAAPMQDSQLADGGRSPRRKRR
jgi:hypothetical protein